MREERTSRCGWEVWTSSRRHGSHTGNTQPSSGSSDMFSSSNTKERSGRGVLSWLNLMSVGESDRTRPGTVLGRSLSRLDQDQASHWGAQAGRSRRTQELCDRWNGLELDIDEILEAPLETNLTHSLANSDRDFQPFIQTQFRQGVLPQGNKAEPLHLFHTIRNRKHVLHCYEFLLMRTLDEDDNLWVKLCEKFGHCDQCEQEGCTPKSPRHSHTAMGSLPAKDPFSINSIHPDMWFLAITLKESKDKLIHFIRSELPKRKDDIPLPGSQKPLHANSFLSSYLSAFNFVEMNLDNVFRFGDVTNLPKELFRCSNLKTLSLRHNFLDTVPPDIGRLSKLERLFLTNNKLQNKSIPFTIAFCMNLTELYIDNNLLDALPGILLSLNTLERVHRHGNHNYFKATFMWYHTDVNDRILECPGTPTPPLHTPHSLQQLCALSVIRSRANFYRSQQIPTRVKDYISSLCEGLELCSNCSTPRPQSAPSYKVFTFKNPYLGNTCVPFQHWACSLPCAREVEIPARREQLSQAREQDRQYERYVRESLSRLRPSQRALSANNLTTREGVGERQVLGENISYTTINTTSQQGVVGQNISCGILNFWHAITNNMVRAAYRPVLVLERVLASETQVQVARLHQNTERCNIWRGAGGIGGDFYKAKQARKVVGGALRSLGLSSPHMYQAKLTPLEVTTILRANEYTTTDLPHGPVKSFDMNTLQSNNPIEDSHSEAVLTVGGGLLFGIFDGHGGAACGQVVAKRLLHYIAAGLIPPEDLARHMKLVQEGEKNNQEYSLVKTFNDHFELVQDLRDLFQQSYAEYLETLHKQRVEIGHNDQIHDVGDILIHAYNSLDNDMSREATTRPGGMVNMKTVTVAMSGCVAATAHIEGPHLSVASTGDCTAVVGSLSDTDTWIAKKLTQEHNSDNQKEVKRILAEHPETEHHHIIKGDRLLSILAPLRAFGDFKFKWDRATIEETLGAILGEHACPPNYKTPPYLTAQPEVTYHRLGPRDKFMVIGSDGLWDMMTPMQVVRLVGEHMSGKVTLSPLHLSKPNIPLDDIASLLKQRQAAMRLKPTDSNAATHLIRSALGGTAYGVDHGRLSQMLSLPQDMVRMFRDDITIQVVYFNDEYLRHC